MAPELPRDTPGPVPSQLTPLNGLRHPRAHSSSTSDTSTVTTEPTRTKQAPGHSLTGRRETQTAERREKERERGVERAVQKWASSTACKEQGEKHWRGDAHGVEAMGGEGATVTLAKPQGTFHHKNSGREPTSLPQPCPNTDPANGQFLMGTRASEPPGHGCGSCQRGCGSPRDGDALPAVQAAGRALSPVHDALRHAGTPASPGPAPHTHGGGRGAPDAMPGPLATGPLHPLPGQRGESPAGAAKSTD